MNESDRDFFMTMHKEVRSDLNTLYQTQQEGIQRITTLESETKSHYDSVKENKRSKKESILFISGIIAAGLMGIFI